MRFPIAAFGFSLSATAILAMLAGCSGISQSATPALEPTPSVGTQPVQRQVVEATRTPVVASRPVTTPSFMSPGTVGKPLIFESDISGGAVEIFSQSGKSQKMIGQITGLNAPQGLATDPNGNLYVANPGSSNVLVFAPPYTSPPTLTLADTGSPYGVAVSPAGVVAVTGLHGGVTFYDKGSTTACATVSDGNFPTIYYDAFDAKGNLYIDGAESAGSKHYTVVGEIRGGCQARTLTLLLKTENFYPFPGGGVQIDKRGRIAIQNSEIGIIETYNPPQHGSFGNPVSTYELKSGAAYDFAFRASGNTLYNADCFFRQCSAVITEYDGYPESEPSENVIYPASRDPRGGVAVSPPLVP